MRFSINDFREYLAIPFLYVKRNCWKFCVRLIFVVGLINIVMVGLAFTSVPYWAVYWLGTSKSGTISDTDYIILMGGAGMPSRDNLIRAYYTADLMNSDSSARVIIALPGDTSDTEGAVITLKRELNFRNVRDERIGYELNGTNTRLQALYVKDLISDPANSLVIVTSPSHMRRSIMSFEKAGFSNVRGYSAFNRDINLDLHLDTEKTGGNKFIPEIDNGNLRYRFWNYYTLEIEFLRELMALGYYRLKGWI